MIDISKKWVYNGLCEERSSELKNKKIFLSIAGMIILIILGVLINGNAFEFIAEESFVSESEIPEISESADNTEEYSEETEIITSAEPDTSSCYSETETEPITEDNNIILESGSYTTPEDVAEYIHTFGTLPHNFITKDEAVALGWDKSKGNLWEVADGMSIGGDRFGNYEGLLPDSDGRIWTECDVNYNGGFRGAERIIFSNDGLIFYTDDHYQTFEQLY